MKYKCIIIEDDIIFQQLLCQYVQKTDCLTLQGSFNSAIDAYQYIEENKIDIIITDIDLPEMSGLDFIKTLAAKPEVILISGHENFAIESYEYNVTDFIYKPQCNYPRFLKAIKNAKKNILKNKVNYFFLKEGTKYVKIQFNDLVFIEAFGDYVKLYKENSIHLTLSSLKDIFEKLPEAKFVQVHRSFIINMDKIDEIEGNIIRIGKNRIPISKAYKKGIFDKIG